jgi:serine/threonine-protein kinase
MQPSRSAGPVTLKSARVAVAPERVSSSDGAQGFQVQDKFDLHGLLGEGGMGRVFIAHDKRLGRVVALKVLRSEYDRDADLLRRFALEAQVGAQLEHPNIVPLYSLERSADGGPAFAMQLVEGTTMAQYIYDAAGAPKEARAATGEYALKKRLGKLLGACDAMQFAHARGVIHRDLKPENIMLGAHHEVYVMDWGLARVTVEPSSIMEEAGDGEKPAPKTFDLAPSMVPRTPAASESSLDAAQTLLRGAAAADALDSAATMVAGSAAAVGGGARVASSAERATQHGMVMGTYQYMPPEQAMGLLDQMGPTADQYALGLILLELGTLQPARSFVSATDAQREAILNQYRAEQDVDGKALDPALMAIVARTTQGKPADRYPSVEALAEDVRRFIRDEPVSVYQEGSAKRALRVAAGHPIAAMSALSAVLILGALAVIASLAQSAATARRAAHDLDGLKRLLVAVQSRAHEVDVHLSDYAVGVERVGAVAREILSHGTHADPAALKAITDAPPPELKWSERSHTALNFHAGLLTWAGRAQGAAPPASIAAVKRVLMWQRDALVSTLSPAVIASTEAVQEQALEAGKSPLLRVFVGLPDGAYAQYPARAIPDSYDVRKRQWYHMAIASRSLAWHPPIASPDGATLRLPVLLPMRRGDEFLGAVAADMAVDEFAETLLLANMPGFVDAYLVTEEGKVAVRRGLAAQVLKPGADSDADVALPAVPNAALAARMIAGEKGGYVESKGRLLLFVRMLSPAWYYVAEFERGPYLSARLPGEKNGGGATLGAGRDVRSVFAGLL